MKRRAFARHCAFYGACVLWTILLSPSFLVLMATPRRWCFLLSRMWTRGLLLFAKQFLGLSFEVSGCEHLPKGGFIVASQHQSTWETIVFNILVEDPVFILKKSLLWMPIVGWYLWRIGMIPVSRNRKNNRESRSRITERVVRTVHQGRPVIIFPEGRRIQAGVHAPYRPGVWFFYNSCGVPVVPVALNSGCFWARRTFFKKPGVVRLVFLPPIPPGIPKEEFMETLRTRIEDTSSILCAREPSSASFEKCYLSS